MFMEEISGEQDRIEPRSALSRPHRLKPVPASSDSRKVGRGWHEKSALPNGRTLAGFSRSGGQLP
jgi:hypothetical protein